MGKIVQTAGRDALGAFAPEFAHFNDDVLFGENWNNEDIDLKTRCITTVVALMSSGITDSSLKYHLENARQHGVSKEEIAAIITHTAFYAGWPKAWAVFNMAKEIWTDEAVDSWDKTFPKSGKVEHKKITFHNRYGISLSADMYTPANVSGKLPAIAVSGPFGAVKEQASGLYAQTMAEMGFLTIAFDPSFTGESGGMPRYVASPDINTEDFCAAVDFLSVQDSVDCEKIGIIGICGWGGMALNAAAIDTRIKATVASTMYDMTRVTANGYFDSEDSEAARYEKRRTLNAQRTMDYRNGSYALAGGVADTIPDDAPQFVKDYFAYYKTKRGYHSRSLNSNNGWNVTSSLSFMNMPILQYSSEIRSAALLIHGENAHSCYFSRDVFKRLKGDNKELLIIPGASHTDLYDRTDIIPFDKIAGFFNKYL